MTGGAAVMFSLYPALVAYVGVQSPFLFGAALGVGSVAALSAFLLIARRSLFVNAGAWRVIRRRALDPAALLCALGLWDAALYARAAGFIDVSAVAVIYEIRHLALIVLFGWIFRDGARARGIDPFAIIAFAFALLGAASVVVSQAGGISNIAALGEVPPYTLALGVALALGAAALGALKTFCFRWGADLARDLHAADDERDGRGQPPEIFGAAVGLIICFIAVIPVMAMTGLARNESAQPTSLLAALALGPLTVAIPLLLGRKAESLVGESSGVGAIWRFVPALSLAWLYALSLAGDADAATLLIGAGVIIGANLLAFVEERRRRSAASRPPVSEGETVRRIIARGESGVVEFKSTLRYNLRSGRNDHRMERAVVKTLAAFLNTAGGTLLIGVADDGEPLGASADRFANADAMRLHLRNIVNRDMGAAAMTRIHAAFPEHEGATVTLITCDPPTGDRPVFVGASQEFYIRTGASTDLLYTADAHAYILTATRAGRFS